MFASIRRSFSGEMHRTRINKLILRPNLLGIANEIVHSYILCHFLA